MNVYTDISEIPRKKNTIITIGTFDGLHAGHMCIIRRLNEVANSKGGRSLVITFDPHPRSVVAKNSDFKLLTSTREKISLFRKTGIDSLLILKFTPEIAGLTSEDFFRLVIAANTGISELIIGYDHRLGKNRDGDEGKLRRLGHIFSFGVEMVNAVSVDGTNISSTKIRHALLEGDVEKASVFLERNYSLSGTIVKGAQRGRTLGFPTANVLAEDRTKLIPANGVYFVELLLHDEDTDGFDQKDSVAYKGLMNIGMRPTFGDVEERVAEVFIFDFNNDIYGRKVTVNFIRRIREEKKFSSRQELISQMKDDRNNALGI